MKYNNIADSEQTKMYATVSKFFTSYIETWRVPAKVFNPPFFTLATT
jgi:hypothetical protein